MPQKPEPRRVDKPIAGPSPTFIERMRGKREGDIELPNTSGITDPRLKKKKGIFDLAGRIREGTGQK